MPITFGNISKMVSKNCSACVSRVGLSTEPYSELPHPVALLVGFPSGTPLKNGTFTAWNRTRTVLGHLLNILLPNLHKPATNLPREAEQTLPCNLLHDTSVDIISPCHLLHGAAFERTHTLIPPSSKAHRKWSDLIDSCPPPLKWANPKGPHILWFSKIVFMLHFLLKMP